MADGPVKPHLHYADGVWWVINVAEDFTDGDELPHPNRCDRAFATEAEALEEITRRLTNGTPREHES